MYETYLLKHDNSDLTTVRKTPRGQVRTKAV